MAVAVTEGDPEEVADAVHVCAVCDADGEPDAVGVVVVVAGVPVAVPDTDDEADARDEGDEVSVAALLAVAPDVGDGEGEADEVTVSAAVTDGLTDTRADAEELRDGAGGAVGPDERDALLDVEALALGDDEGDSLPGV